MSAFVLPLSDIDEYGKEWTFPIEPSWLAAALEGTGLGVGEHPVTGTLDVKAQKSGEDVLVRCHIHTRIVTPCSRCLEDVPLPIDLDVTSLIEPEHKRPAAESEEDLDDEVDREYYAGDKVVLDAIVREHIVLEDPMQPLCRPDCPGIAIPEHVKPPADFGREEGPVDPRLAPLLKLKRKLAQNEE